MNYKELTVENVNEVIELFINAFNGEPWNDEWTEDIVRKRLSQMISWSGSYGLIAYDDEKVVGMILGNTEYYYNCIHFEISEFCVDTMVKGKGYGRIILEEFERRLKMIGVDEILLKTSRAVATVGFYSRLGYKEVEEIVLMNKMIYNN